ncbi:MAG: hypothetical protein AAB407_01230 [Patescibacteria group bacterium]
MRRFLLIVSIIIIIVVGGFFGWQFWKNRASLQENTVTNLPPIESIFTKESASALLSYATLESGALFGVKENGSVVSMTENGEEELFSQNLNNVVSATFSPTGAYILFETAVNGLTSLSVLDVTNKTWNPLPGAISLGAWHPSQDRVAYLKGSPSPALVTFDIKTKKTAEVMPFSLHDAVLAWKTAQEIYITGRPASSVTQAAWSARIADKTIRKIIPETPALDTLWSKDGVRALFMGKSGRNHTLFLTNLAEETALENFANTLPSKCVIEGTTVFCGIPNSIPSGSLLPDDYEARMFYTEDAIFSWDIISGTVTRIDTPDIISVDVYKPTLRGDRLFFLNRYDRLLYSLPIKELESSN